MTPSQVSEEQPSRASKIWERTRVGGSLAVAVALLLWGASTRGGAYWVLACGVAMALGCVSESRALRLFPRPASGQCPALGAIGVLAAGGLLLWRVKPGSDAAAAHWEILGLLILTVVVVGGLGWMTRLISRARPLYTLGALLWICVPLPALYLVVIESGVAGLGALILLSKVGDIAGYYTGNLLGARFPHHPFPRLSPGKTTVGCIGSFAVGAVAGPIVAFAGWLPELRWGWVSALLAAALINVASQAGDLLESAGKRRAGVKDSGMLFGPSGGFLDLVDSLLLSVPVWLVAGPMVFVMAG